MLPDAGSRPPRCEAIPLAKYPSIPRSHRTFMLGKSPRSPPPLPPLQRRGVNAEETERQGLQRQRSEAARGTLSPTSPKQLLPRD